MSASDLKSFLEKFSDIDPDIRHVAILDATKYAQENSHKWSADECGSVVRACLDRLGAEKNANCKSLVVSCLAEAVTTASSKLMASACESLCGRIVGGSSDSKTAAGENDSVADSEIRDVFATGLQKLLAVAPPTCGPAASTVLEILLPALTVTTTSNASHVHALSGVAAVIQRFGHTLSPEQHAACHGALFPLIESPHEAVALQATAALGLLAPHMPDELLHTLVGSLVEKVEAQALKPSRLVASVRMLDTVCQQAGYRLGAHAARITSLLTEVIGTPGPDNNMPLDNVVRQRCLQTLQSLVQGCSINVRPNISPIVSTCLSTLVYDPNYEYSADAKMDADDSGEDDSDDYDDYDSSDLDDDEDDSWKTRRASANCLMAVITTRPDLTSTLYDQCAGILITQFREHEQSVLLDVLACFTALLKASASVATPWSVAATVLPPSPAPLRRQASGAEQAGTYLPRAIAAACARLGEDSLGSVVRVPIWRMLGLLITVVSTDTGAIVSTLRAHRVMALVLSDLADHEDGPACLGVLDFVGALLSSTGISSFDNDTAASFATSVCALASHSWPNLAAKALGIIAVVAKAAGSDSAHTEVFLSAAMERLVQKDADAKIKSASIQACSALVAFGGAPAPKAAAVVSTLLDRLSNEATRLATLEAFVVMSSSPLSLDLTQVATGLTDASEALLRLQTRSHVVATIQALSALLTGHLEAFSNATVELAINRLASVVSAGSHMQACTIAIQTANSLLDSSSTASLVLASVLEPAMLLCRRDSTHDDTLEALESFFASCVTHRGDVAKIFAGLSEPMRSERSRNSTARCLAAAMAAASETARVQAIQSIITGISGKKTSVLGKTQLVASLGEIGHYNDLVATHSTDLLDTIAALYFDESQAADMRTAVLKALGGLICGAFRPGLQWLLHKRHDFSKAAVLQIISHSLQLMRRAPSSVNVSSISTLSEQLAAFYAGCEEDTMELAASCMGMLATLLPATIRDMASLFREGTEMQRTIAVLSIGIFARVAPLEDLENAVLDEFWASVSSEPLKIRCAGAKSLAACIRRGPAWVRPLLKRDGTAAGVLAALFAATIPDRSHIHKVDLVQSKVKIDFGLDLRMAAHRCIAVAARKHADCVDTLRFFDSLRTGLGDAVVVQRVCCDTLIKLAKDPAWQTKLVAQLHEFVKVEAKVLQKAKKVVGSGEVVARVTYALSSLPGAAQVGSFAKFLENVRESPASADHWEAAIAADSAPAAGTGAGRGAGAGVGAGAGASARR